MLGATLAALAAGSVARLIRLRHAEKTLRDRRLASLRTWWILTVVAGACILAGRPGVCLLLTVASGIGWREYTAALGTRPHDQPAVRAGYVIVVINYALILLDRASAFVVFVPVGALLILAVVQLLQGRMSGYIRMTGGLFWGLMFLVYGLSHAALLFILPETSGGPVGPAGWFLYLLILTESNDIFQSVIGRNLAAHKRHRITPTISPNKTWEGFLGGMLVTVGLAVLLAPWLTTLSHETGPLALPHPLQPWAAPFLAGLVVAVAGFLGDINMSAIKRDADIKNSSTLLPGMGGLIDRIDSLTITAPAFAYFLIWWIP